MSMHGEPVRSIEHYTDDAGLPCIRLTLMNGRVYELTGAHISNVSVQAGESSCMQVAEVKIEPVRLFTDKK